MSHSNEKKTDTPAALEMEILEEWKKKDIFKKVLAKESPKGEFISYDGPPFATGLPHYGHILASVIKDSVFRYQTMRGYHVPRTWGWDCHGLPIENIVEKELGFKHKKDIKEYGIEKFNERCREQVLAYASEWEKIIPRIGRWVDMKQSWRTMDLSFMESVWWVFKTLHEKGLVYEDYRAMHICPRCETTLSQQEVAEGYKDVKDLAVTVKFKLKSNQNFGNGYVTGNAVYMLAWTTTPWTLPGNVALAVGRDIHYTALRMNGLPELLIVASERVQTVFKDQSIEIVHDDLTGADLLGLQYDPPFGYYIKDTVLPNRENGWKVYAADFVTADSGTGIAHEAPAFGADDWALAQKEHLPFVQHVGMDGVFKSEVTDFLGLQVKPAGDPTATDVEVIKYLAKEGTLFSKEKIEHSYPHCWRCDTPLLNYATSSWFVSVTRIKEDLLKNAEAITWSPSHIKEGRFGKWLEGARDWSISRQRFWASVIPVWVCDSCKKQKVFGSVAELEAASGEKIHDLHKHIVDEVVVPCECGHAMHRVSDVLDTWFDSGSMPYGERHYPFENKEVFDASFPAQFIAEGLDQTRAWFYYLHVLAGATFNKSAFRNAIVNGIVLAGDGRKMSKKLKNYPDPMEVVEKYGADSLRFYLLSSPVTQSENLSFSEKSVDEIVKKNIGRLNNILAFFKLYDNGASHRIESNHVLDRWILARLAELTQEVTEGFEHYQLDAAMRPITGFVDDLSVWYLRRSRDRFKTEGEDKDFALATLARVLRELSKIIAPSMPFISEHIYRSVGGEEESVHLTAWPTASVVDVEVVTKMQIVRDVVSVGLEKRSSAGIKVRQPLASMTVTSSYGKLSEEYVVLIRDELNIKEVHFAQMQSAQGSAALSVELDTTLTPELIREGQLRDIVRAIQDLRKKKNLKPGEKAVLVVTSSSTTVESFVRSAGDDLMKTASLSAIEYTAGTEEGESFVFPEGKVTFSLK